MHRPVTLISRRATDWETRLRCSARLRRHSVRVKRAKRRQEPRQPRKRCIQLRRRTGAARPVEADCHYVGSRGLKLFANQQYNYFDPTTGLRLNPARGAVNARINDAAPNYNSIQNGGDTAVLARSVSSPQTTFMAKTWMTARRFRALRHPNSSTRQTSLRASGSRITATRYLTIAIFLGCIFVVARWLPLGPRRYERRSRYLTRRWTASGVTQLQSGSTAAGKSPDSTPMVSGNPFNDRPLIGNIKAPFTTGGIDGSYVGATRDVLRHRPIETADGSPGSSRPAQVHFLVPSGGAEITRRKSAATATRTPARRSGISPWKKASRFTNALRCCCGARRSLLMASQDPHVRMTASRP